MRINQIGLSVIVVGLLTLCSAARATPVTTLAPLPSNGTDVYGVFVYSDAADTLNLSEFGPNPISNIFCNYSNGGCMGASIGQTVYLGPTGPGIVFGLSDVTVANTYTTDALAADGYAHDLVSVTVDASDAAAVASAYSVFGQGALNPLAAASIATLGQTPGTIVTFVGWEDRINGDYDYNDLIFAFTDPVIPMAVMVPEPATIALIGFGLVVIGGWARRRAKIDRSDG